MGAGLAADAKEEVGGKIRRYTSIAETASVEKGAKLDREGKRKLSNKNGEELTEEELTEEKEMKAEATAKTEREAKQTKKAHNERTAKAEKEVEAFKDAANAFPFG